MKSLAETTRRRLAPEMVSTGLKSLGQKPGPNKKTQRSVGVPAAPRPKPNRTWVVSGVLITIASGLTAYVAYLNLVNRVEVVILSRPVPKGDFIEFDDLSSIGVPDDLADSALTMADFNADPEQLVGKVTDASLDEGVLVVPSMLSGSPLPNSKTAVAGASLVAGQYPIPKMVPGDRVAVISYGAGVPVSEFDQEQAGGPRILAKALVVSAELSPRSNSEVFVSLEVRSEDLLTVSEALTVGSAGLALIEYDDERAELFPSLFAAPDNDDSSSESNDGSEDVDGFDPTETDQTLTVEDESVEGSG